MRGAAGNVGDFNQCFKMRSRIRALIEGGENRAMSKNRLDRLIKQNNVYIVCILSCALDYFR